MSINSVGFYSFHARLSNDRMATVVLFALQEMGRINSAFIIYDKQSMYNHCILILFCYVYLYSYK